MNWNNKKANLFNELVNQVIDVASVINNGREPKHIVSSMVSEVGELSIEVLVHNNHSYKQAGVDEVIGEAVDVLNTVIDYVYVLDEIHGFNGSLFNAFKVYLYEYNFNEQLDTYQLLAKMTESVSKIFNISVLEIIDEKDKSDAILHSCYLVNLLYDMIVQCSEDVTDEQIIDFMQKKLYKWKTKCA